MNNTVTYMRFATAEQHNGQATNNAVIYPRFSSHGQNEMTIEGQIRICREYAESQGYNVVGIYPEKARTGTNDSRPAFQRMIKDAASGQFQYIIVYMFDRFARNRHDSILYKEMLKRDYGIKVLSATQPISDDEGGEFYEMFLEWNDEKYSKRLSKRIKNGLDTCVENGTFTGSRVPFGYRLIDTDRKGKKARYIKSLSTRSKPKLSVTFLPSTPKALIKRLSRTRSTHRASA